MFSLKRLFFRCIARFSVSIAFEAVVLRRSSIGVEVFLTRRRKQDSYAGLWHCPGSIFRPRERAQQVADRLGRREFGVAIRNFTFVGDHFFEEERGTFLSRIYITTLAGEPTCDGQWWPVDALPVDIVPPHRDVIIPEAVASWR